MNLATSYVLGAATRRNLHYLRFYLLSPGSHSNNETYYNDHCGERITYIFIVSDVISHIQSEMPL